MPTKRKVLQKQKQRQKQTTIVNINVAKARARANAKKSGKSRGRGSVVMLPPPIYASPIDRLTPAMYSSQGQQISQQPLEQLLKNFLSNQQNQQVGSFKTLGSAPSSSYYPGSSNVSYNPSLGSGDPIPDYGSTSSYPRPLNPDEYFAYNDETKKIDRLKRPVYDISDDVSEMTDMSDVPAPFNNEERSYLSASEPDYEANAPKFSQNESRVSQGNIYESIKNIEPEAIDRSSKHFYDMLNRMEEKTQKEIDKLTPQIPEPFRRPDRRPPKRIELDEESILTGTPASKVNIIPFEDNMSSSTFSSDSLNTLNPYPKNIFNKMMGFN